MTQFGSQHRINLDRWRKQPGSTQHSDFSQNQTPATAENAESAEKAGRAAVPDGSSVPHDPSAQAGDPPPRHANRAPGTPVPVPHGPSAGENPGAGEEWRTVVTEDYQVVKVASYVIENLKREVRKQLGVPPEWAADEEKAAYHRQQLALLEKANAAPRCQHIYADGTRCRGPKLRGGKKCYAHDRMEAARPERLRLPSLEDANSVVLAVMEIQRALLDGLISEKTAGLLLYSVQIGAWAVQRVTFRETEPGEMVRVRPAASAQQSAVSKNRERIHRGHAEARKKDERPTAKDAKYAEEKSAPARVPAPHDLSHVHEPSAQPGAAVPHECGIPGMNGVSPMNSGMNGEG